MHDYERTKAWHRANALAWWVAATLARRNSRLIVWEHHPKDGFYDCLGLRDGELSHLGIRSDVNRGGGSVHVHGEPMWSSEPLHALLSAAEPLEIVKKVEQQARWQSGRRATTGRSLTYRVIAQVLQSLVDDRHHWDVRQIRDRDHWGYGEAYPEPAVLDGFARGRQLLETLPRGGSMFHPWENVWLLTRDDEPVAAFDTEGRVVVGDQPVAPMMPMYEAAGRRIFPVIARTLGEMLP